MTTITQPKYWTVPDDPEEARYWEWIRDAQTTAHVAAVARTFVDAITERTAELFAGEFTWALQERLKVAIVDVLADTDDANQEVIARCAAGLGIVPDWCPADEGREALRLHELEL